jgi:hypothetical protein
MSDPRLKTEVYPPTCTGLTRCSPGWPHAAEWPGGGSRQATQPSARTWAQLPLTSGTEEIEDCAWVSAELTDDVPVIADWIAVHSACDTFG